MVNGFPGSSRHARPRPTGFFRHPRIPLNFEIFWGRYTARMENRKVIVASYVICGMVVWFLTRSSLDYLYLKFYHIRRLAGIDVAREALPVILALVTFMVLLRNAKVNPYLDDVASEIRKVTWPSRDDVVKSTTVVIICIVIASFILAGFDLVWGQVVSLLLHS